MVKHLVRELRDLCQIMMGDRQEQLWWSSGNGDDGEESQVSWC